MAAPGMIDVTEFTCPVCGSHRFGTTIKGPPLDARTNVGHCHNIPCKFTWPRSDDAKYFHKTGRQIAATVSTNGMFRR